MVSSWWLCFMHHRYVEFLSPLVWYRVLKTFWCIQVWVFNLCEHIWGSLLYLSYCVRNGEYDNWVICKVLVDGLLASCLLTSASIHYLIHKKQGFKLFSKAMNVPFSDCSSICFYWVENWFAMCYFIYDACIWASIWKTREMIWNINDINAVWAYRGLVVRTYSLSSNLDRTYFFQ